MSKQQRDAIDAAMRAEPFDLSQSPAEHRKSFEALMLRSYPAAVEDGLAAYAGLLESGASPSRVLVAGDSAGGGLAVATLLAAREQGLPQPAAVAVFSPWADISRSSSSMRTKDGADPLFSYDAMGWYADLYVPAGDRSAPLASPVFAALAGLPPLLIQVGSHEVLLDDAVRLAANAGRDDVEVILQVAPKARTSSSFNSEHWTRPTRPSTRSRGSSSGSSASRRRAPATNRRAPQGKSVAWPADA
jgi:acetyl esterase/lipase